MLTELQHIRWKIEDSKVDFRLITSKNRIAPIPMDIVRLEICGAVLSKRKRIFIQEEIRISIKKILYTVKL